MGRKRKHKSPECPTDDRPVGTGHNGRGFQRFVIKSRVENLERERDAIRREMTRENTALRAELTIQREETNRLHHQNERLEQRLRDVERSMMNMLTGQYAGGQMAPGPSPLLSLPPGPQPPIEQPPRHYTPNMANRPPPPPRVHSGGGGPFPRSSQSTRRSSTSEGRSQSRPESALTRPRRTRAEQAQLAGHERRRREDYNARELASRPKK
jgi:hypothetical protein